MFLSTAIGERRELGVHRGDERVLRGGGLAHQATEKGVLVVRVERFGRERQLLVPVVVGLLELLAERAQEAGDRAVLGDRVERARDFDLVLGQRLTELRLEQEDDPLAVGGAQALQQRAVLAEARGRASARARRARERGSAPSSSRARRRRAGTPRGA